MRLALAVMGGLAITVAGCASIDTQKERLAAAKICCQGPHQFRYKDLPPTGELSLSISDESPVFEFPSGRSYFDAVRLGRADQSAKVRIKIHPARAYPRLGTFCPSLTFLTAQFDTIQTKYEPPRWHQAFWTSAFFFADYEIPAGAVYAVIHSEASRSGESLTRVVPTEFQSWGSGPMALSGVLLNAIQLLSSGTAFTETQHIPCAPTATGTLAITHGTS